MIPAAAGLLGRGNDAPSTVAQPDGGWGHFTRRHAVALLFMREHVPALRDLERGPWACLLAIAPHWQAGRMDAFPGQERLAMLSGYDSRSIRDFTKQLEASGVLNVVRVKLTDGTARLHYEPGPVLLNAVEQFDARYSDGAKPEAAAVEERTAVRGIRAKRAHPPEPPEVVSGGGPAAISGELSDRRDQNSSSLDAAPGALASNGEAGSQASETDRSVAREVLGVLRERRFGRRGGLFDAKVVAMVAACVSVVDGDRKTKLRAQLDAIEHAFSVSRDTPTPSYIWGSVDHFLGHEAQGRGARVAAERARAQHSRSAQAERLLARELSRQEREACAPPPEVLEFLEAFQRGHQTPQFLRSRG